MWLCTNIILHWNSGTGTLSATWSHLCWTLSAPSPPCCCYSSFSSLFLVCLACNCSVGSSTLMRHVGARLTTSPSLYSQSSRYLSWKFAKCNTENECHMQVVIVLCHILNFKHMRMLYSKRMEGHLYMPLPQPTIFIVYVQSGGL